MRSTVSISERSRGILMRRSDRYEQDTLDAWTALFKRTFRFVGPEIVREFLESSGVLERSGLSTISFRRTA